MAAGTHTHPFGTTFGYSTTSSGFTFFSDLQNVQTPPQTRKHSDNSDLSNSEYELTSPSWFSATDGTFLLYFIQAVYQILLTAFNAGTIYYWEILYPLIGAQSVAGYNDVFQGYVSEIGVNQIEKLGDDKIQRNCTVRKVGAITSTNGS